VNDMQLFCLQLTYLFPALEGKIALDSLLAGSDRSPSSSVGCTDHLLRVRPSGSRGTRKLVCVQQLRAVTRCVVGKAAASLAYDTRNCCNGTYRKRKPQVAIRSNAQNHYTFEFRTSIRATPMIASEWSINHTCRGSNSWHGNIQLQ